MEPDFGGGSLEGFLAAHKSVEIPSAFAPGDQFGDWRVTALLGRGGSGEVYRVVHAMLGTEAALKVCVRDEERDDIRDAAVCNRFRNEARMLADNTHPAFPRFLGFGEREGRPWYAMELLEHRPLPASGKGIARFLLVVASGVGHLHSLGLVHRDIKPANILWRDSVPVLVDLGLVKDTSAVRGHAGDSLSIVDGKAVGVGTPRYAAPEQLRGGEITPAADVYALGMLANECFGGRPPRAWERIIRRATASIPEQRYGSVAEFVRAVRRRNLAAWAAAAFAGVALSAAVLAAVSAVWREVAVDEAPGGRRAMAEPSAGRPVELSPVMALVGEKVRLPGPVVLKGGREYAVVGPGRLVADISGPSNAVLRLDNCEVQNTTTLPYPANGLKYELDNGAFLNFVWHGFGDPNDLRDAVVIRDKGSSAAHVGGPMTKAVYDLMTKARRRFP